MASDLRNILEILGDVNGISKLVPDLCTSTLLVFEDQHGSPLSSRLKEGPIPVNLTVNWAVEIAGILANIHRKGVIHKDFNLHNILLSGPEMRPLIIDFDLATVSTEERPSFIHHNQIAGTLAYMAPEQTGRMSRPVDHRVDIYAFGVTLYQLVTGRLPFKQTDPLRLIHDHLARIPIPPSKLDPHVAPALSDIIMNMLEKEPDRRYQSAEGLERDLIILRERLAKGDTAPFSLCESDFPLRLSAPRIPVGRESEVDFLLETFEKTAALGVSAVFISGEAGVGKTALVNEMRPGITGLSGWLVSGKFEQFHPHFSKSALLQALRQLGRLLLAEPNSSNVQHRDALLERLGPNAGLVTRLLPEFEALIGPHPHVEFDASSEIQTRLLHAILEILCTYVSRERPVVLFLDDMQWADSSTIQLIEMILMDERLTGLLFIGAFQDKEVDAAHPVRRLLNKLKSISAKSELLVLENLQKADFVTFLGEMLRLDSTHASLLANDIVEFTNGNPLDSVEFVNMLRQENALIQVPGPEKWQWNREAVQRLGDRSGILPLLARRIRSLPPGSRALLNVMACVGNDVDLDLLATASELAMPDLHLELKPLLDKDLLLTERSQNLQVGRSDLTVHFRHARVHQAAYSEMDTELRKDTHLVIARRLASNIDYATNAADQYLPVFSELTEPEERHYVINLFHNAAKYACISGAYASAEKYLAAAVTMLELEDSDWRRGHVNILVAWHFALYSLGRYKESDEVYEKLEAQCNDLLMLAEAMAIQVSSLSVRGNHDIALSRGLSMLHRLGLDVPATNEHFVHILQGGLESVLHQLSDPDWHSKYQDAAPADAHTLTTVRLVAQLCTPAFFHNPAIACWLVFQNQRLLFNHPVIGASIKQMADLVLVLTPGGHYDLAYSVLRDAIRLGEEHGFPTETALARHYFSAMAFHWHNPLEGSIEQSRLAYESLMRAGNLPFAGYSFHTKIIAMVDTAPTIETIEVELESALSFARRYEIDVNAFNFLFIKQFMRALRGETREVGSFNDASFNEKHYFVEHKKKLTGSVFFVFRALSALLFGDAEALKAHSDERVIGGAFQIGFYTESLRIFVQLMAISQELRVADADSRARLIDRWKVGHEWIVNRATTAPMNFGPMRRLVEADYWLAMGDIDRASGAFEDAILLSENGASFWQRGFILERAGDFQLGHGFKPGGRLLLARARRVFEDWGASGKVKELDRRYPFLTLRKRTSPRKELADRDSLSIKGIDLRAILNASQTLSSDMDLSKLSARAIDLLGAMTGATNVSLAVMEDEPRGWVFFSSAIDDHAESAPQSISIEEAGDQQLIPLSAFRAVIRSRAALVVDDATLDERFASDPYFYNMDSCSLFVFPIHGHGLTRAVLQLENRLVRGAFHGDKLETVMLIAGQLAVSLENALLYRSLEKKVAARTVALEEANTRLVELSATDPLTGLANRRQLDATLALELSNSKKNGTTLSFAMLDVDEFKKYNDLYGHVVGDACLQLVARTIAQNMRQNLDFACRYGGEEFAFVLPGANAEDAQAFADRIRLAISALAEPHAASALGIVTVSIGIATLNSLMPLEAEALIQHADKALYLAKSAGRNCVRAVTID